jgi:ABC-type lipoprotein export system ATPase subunit
LNQDDHITIVLVTHDAGVAQYAKRAIRIHDGLIEAGAYVTGGPQGAIASAREGGSA